MAEDAASTPAVIATDEDNGYQVGLATKLVYSVGALCESIKMSSFGMFLLFYYTTVLGLPASLLGLAMAVGLVWDAAMDPLIGHVSDRTTLKFGRRHSFMLAGAVCAGASYIAVFNPPAGFRSGALFAWLMVSDLLFRSGQSLFMVPYYALGAELTTDYQERTSISGYRAAAVLAGMVVVTAVAFRVFFPNEAMSGAGSKFDRDSYASMGVVFGLAITGVALAATFGTLHERARLGLGLPVAAQGGAFTLHRTVLETLRHHAFRVVLLSSAVGGMGMAINGALLLHFLTYYVRVTASHGFASFFIAFYAGALAGVFVWVRATTRFEKHHVCAATAIATAFVISSGYWLVGEGRPFGTGSPWIVVLASGLAGFFSTAGAVIAPSMMADITADDELHTGRRRDGIYFGIYCFGTKISAGVAALIAGLLVDRFAGLVPAQVEQSAATIERLVMVSNLLPAALIAGGAFIVLRYDLTRRRVLSIQGELAAVAGPAASPRIPECNDREHGRWGS